MSLINTLCEEVIFLCGELLDVFKVGVVVYQLILNGVSTPCHEVNLWLFHHFLDILVPNLLRCVIECRIINSINCQQDMTMIHDT